MSFLGARHFGHFVKESDVLGRCVTSHVPQVTSAAPDIFAHGREVDVGDGPLLAELTDHGGDRGVVVVVDPGEEVVLDLVVEAPVQEAEEGSAHIGRGHHLQNKTSRKLNLKTNLILCCWLRWVQ